MKNRVEIPDSGSPTAEQGFSAETLARIEQRYSLCNRDAVVDFLAMHPTLWPVLLEFAGLVPAQFATASLFLRVVDTGSTLDGPDGRLVLFIATDLGFEEAMDRMDRLMAVWRPDVRCGTGEPFSVGLAFGTTADAVEEAAQQVSHAHGGGDSAHRDQARRLFIAPEGSKEEAIAHAERIAAREEEAGTPLAGDALVVLARLRRLQANGRS